MFDWFTWGMGLLQGVIVALVAGVVLLVYIFPKLTDKVASNVIKSLRKDPEFKSIFEKIGQITTKAEPIFEEFKKLDAGKIVKEIEPFLMLMKKIDPQKVNEILDGAKKIVDTFTTKPSVPPPPEFSSPEEANNE